MSTNFAPYMVLLKRLPGPHPYISFKRIHEHFPISQRYLRNVQGQWLCECGVSVATIFFKDSQNFVRRYFFKKTPILSTGSFENCTIAKHEFFITHVGSLMKQTVHVTAFRPLSRYWIFKESHRRWLIKKKYFCYTII